MFSVTTIASSTTRPVASTRARSVIRLMEKPISQIPATDPTSAMGMASAGMSVAPSRPKKTQITAITMRRAAISVFEHLGNGALDEHRVVIGDLKTEIRKALLEPVNGAAYLCRDAHGVGLRLTYDAKADHGPSVEPRHAVGTGKPEIDIGHVAQPHFVRKSRSSMRAGSATVASARTSTSSGPEAKLPTGTSNCARAALRRPRRWRARKPEAGRASPRRAKHAVGRRRAPPRPHHPPR
jgi:hypothetical protein